MVQEAHVYSTEVRGGRRIDRPQIDRHALEEALKVKVEGEVRFDAGNRALYSTDASNYRQVPLGVVIPRSVDDIIATVSVCHAFGAPVLSRGGGTSLAGQCCNVAVVMDMTKYLHHILELNPEEKWARVQPGLVLDDLRGEAEKHHLTFGPDPSTHSHCTLGGMIGNNSCGVHSVMAGKTVDNVIELDVLTYDGLRMTVGQTSDEELERIIREGGRRGEIYQRLKTLRDRYAGQIREHYPHIPRRVSGYNLDSLLPERGFNVAQALVGSEGTCVTVLEARVRLVYSPPKRAMLVLGYPDVFQAGDHIIEIMGSNPIGLEGMDSMLVEDMESNKLHVGSLKLLPEGKGWLIAEYGGETQDEANGKAQQYMEELKRTPNPPSMRLVEDAGEQHRIWKVREAGLGATARIPGKPDAWPGWEDSAAPPERMGDYLREMRKLFDKYGYYGAFYGHFGQGCLHTRISFDLTSKEGIAKWRSFMDEATTICINYGGSLSAEHGDGQARAEFLGKMFGPELLEAFREFKTIWDPDWKMNPGKVVDPYRIDENLRLGAEYNPAHPPTHFTFHGDDDFFSRAVLRCVGVGECRREEGGVMCPSYMATREEMHSTRGRARLLFEMLQGKVLRDGWRDEAVREALDLCLACKGCKGDCPMKVDMATYKAEFLSHYYEGRLRPRYAYSMGLIYWWARIASPMTWLANFITQTPVLGGLAKWAGGISPKRKMPAFASPTFRKWFDRRPERRGVGRKVILWPDTFNNFLLPETAMAATEVLERAGFNITVPRTMLCCGRPLYDFGFLDLAKKLLREILDDLREEIRAGTPVVVLEPSCLAVFRDELMNMFPKDEDAQRLAKQTFSLGEFLSNEARDFKPPSLACQAKLHGHCHQRSVVGMGGEQEMLKRLGIEAELLQDTCCGMAGSFGFERAHYDVSVQVGELGLLPIVRQMPQEMLLVADGFSCREQVQQLTGRKALHLAEVLKMALDQGDGVKENAKADESRESGAEHA